MVSTTLLSSLQGELLDFSKPPVKGLTLVWFWALEMMYALYYAQCLLGIGTKKIGLAIVVTTVTFAILLLLLVLWFPSSLPVLYQY